MHFASPGWIELELDKGTAKNVGQLVATYIEKADEISDLASSISKELSRRGLRGKNAKPITNNIDEADLKFCGNAFTNVAELWNFQGADKIMALSINEFAALKILLSFQRRIESLAKFQMSEMAHFEK